MKCNKDKTKDRHKPVPDTQGQRFSVAAQGTPR